MDFHRFPWIFIDSHGFSWILIDFHWFSWIFIDFHWFSLIPDFYEHPLIFMVFARPGLTAPLRFLAFSRYHLDQLPLDFFRKLLIFIDLDASADGDASADVSGSVLKTREQRRRRSVRRHFYLKQKRAGENERAAWECWYFKEIKKKEDTRKGERTKTFLF